MKEYCTTGVKELAIGIVEMALFDYKRALKKEKRLTKLSLNELEKSMHIYESTTDKICSLLDKLNKVEWEIKQIKAFLYSEWCYTLCGIEKQIWDEYLDKKEQIIKQKNKQKKARRLKNVIPIHKQNQNKG